MPMNMFIWYSFFIAMIKKGETYIIGEIGQNHNGSVDIAKLIKADSVEFAFLFDCFCWIK